MDKHGLRKLVRQRLAAMGRSEKARVSKALSANLKDFLLSLDSNSDIMSDGLVGGFSPLKDEFDWYFDLVETSFHPCVPSISADGSMEFHRVTWTLLSREFMGLTLREGFPLEKPKVVVVPGLAFSPEGARLGRGKGYYDKYLCDRKVFKIGVCSEGQIFDEIETEAHDVLMDAVVTDKNIYKGY